MSEEGFLRIPVPSVEEYVAALSALAPTLAESRRGLLVAHYQSPGHVSTVADLANAVGFESFRGANVQYGTLGRLVAERCGIDPRVKLQMLVRFVRPETLANREWLLVLRPEVCRALEQLGWVEAEPNVLTIRLGGSGGTGRMSVEYLGLLSEKTALERMISETPEEEVISRMSLTDRLDTIQEAISRTEPLERDPTSVLDDEDLTPSIS